MRKTSKALLALTIVVAFNSCKGDKGSEKYEPRCKTKCETHCGAKI